MGTDFNFIAGGYTPSTDFDFGAAENFYYILLGVGDNFTAIWADENATKDTGKVYIGASGYFNVVDLSSKYVYDWYSTTQSGRGGESLEDTNIIDINVSTGV